MLELQAKLQREADQRLSTQVERGDASTREALACAQSMAGALAKATEGAERLREQSEAARSESTKARGLVCAEPCVPAFQASPKYSEESHLPACPN